MFIILDKMTGMPLLTDKIEAYEDPHFWGHLASLLPKNNGGINTSLSLTEVGNFLSMYVGISRDSRTNSIIFTPNENLSSSQREYALAIAASYLVSNPNYKI